MAENKKSFLLYCDLIHTVEKMEDEKAGQLFKHVLRYVNDKDPVTDDMLIELVFEPIKQQLKRDLEKYRKIVERNRANGRKGGRKKNPTEPKKPNGLNGLPKNPSQTDSDNVSDTDSVIDNGKEKDIKVYSNEVNVCFQNCLTHFPERLHPKTDSKKTSWKDVIDKLNRIDKIPFEQIEKVVQAMRNDSFWSKKFLALPKLRTTNGDGIKYFEYFQEQMPKDLFSKHHSDPGGRYLKNDTTNFEFE